MTDTITTEPSEAEAPALPVPEIGSTWINDKRGVLHRVVAVDVDDEGTFIGLRDIEGLRWWVSLSQFHDDCEPFPTGPVPPQEVVWMAVDHRGNQWPIGYDDELTDADRDRAATDARSVEVVRYRVEPTTLTRLR